MKGLPASGKSTYAKKLEAEEHYIRVSKDDIRNGYYGGYAPEKERAVVAMEHEMVEKALAIKANIVIDNTHFNPVHEERYRKLADEHGADFEVKFMDTHVEECIKRNLNRADSVPTEVIVQMYNRHLHKKEDVEYDDELPEAIVVDIDGTLAHIVGDSPRSPYDASRAHEDALDDSVSLITELMYQHGYRVILLTGRHSGHLQVTKEWLDAKGVNYDEIYCRGEGDKRPDYIVKEELYRDNIKGKVNVKFAIDDRPQVVRMWQRLGIKVFNVGAMNVEF